MVVWDDVTTTPHINMEIIRNRMNISSTDNEEDLTQEDDDDNSNSNLIDDEQLQELREWVAQKWRQYFSMGNQTTSQ
ncbi:unnamed protein product [Schistosoma spindalis]|nr:unnamed protein product [Schistosoma spindale]